MHRRPRKVVIPVAGLGTRCLPATKVLPKEMLPVFDRPLIQYALEEAAAAGFEQAILVTSHGKSLIEDHFDRAPELEQQLTTQGKTALLDLVRATLPANIALASVRQPRPLGLGHAIWCARALIDNEPFAVILPDDLVLGETPCLAQMADAWQRTGGHMAAVEEVPRENTNRYGILRVAARDGSLVRADAVVEKPSPEEAPSTTAIIGRYILDPVVLRALDRQERGAGGEIQLTDAMGAGIEQVGFHGFLFRGRRFDCGTPAGLLRASLHVAALRGERIAPDDGAGLQA
jgi:UTP--glucose-1-phosphate uridylyltransferase